MAVDDFGWVPGPLGLPLPGDAPGDKNIELKVAIVTNEWLSREC